MRLSGQKLAIVGFLLVAVLSSGGLLAKRSVGVESSVTVSVGELPPQGVKTYELIHQGGPFAYEKDGTVFGNRERLRLVQKRGYYHEYTVTTPGLSHRGVRRIVCGGQPKTPDVCYYTADHYASFRRIVP